MPELENFEHNLNETKNKIRLCEGRELQDGVGICLKQLLENQHLIIESLRSIIQTKT